MFTYPLTRMLLVGAALLTLSGCVAHQGTGVDAPPPQPVVGDVFNTVRHLVIDDINHDGYETITVLAHLCPSTTATCPDGTEEVVPVVSKILVPGMVFLSAPEAFVEPPEICRADDMVCRMSVVHCTFATAEDQAAATFCLPPAGAVTPSPRPNGSGHPCVDRPTERSHHISYTCMTGQATG